jgi:hypothetical protein
MVRATNAALPIASQTSSLSYIIPFQSDFFMDVIRSIAKMRMVTLVCFRENKTHDPSQDEVKFVLTHTINKHETVFLILEFTTCKINQSTNRKCE